MQIEMLGQLEVRTDDGVEVRVPGPSDPENALHRLAVRLRKALPDGLVETQFGGYRLMVAPSAIDVVRFEGIVDQARDCRRGAP